MIMSKVRRELNQIIENPSAANNILYEREISELGFIQEIKGACEKKLSCSSKQIDLSPSSHVKFLDLIYDSSWECDSQTILQSELSLSLASFA